MMARGRHILGQALAGVTLLFPVLLLGLCSWPHYIDGLVREAAVPVPNRMILMRSQSRDVLRQAARLLSAAPPQDGEAGLIRAEALLKSGGGDVRPLLRSALAYQPASVRGWLLLSGAEAGQGQGTGAAGALDLALLLSSKNYFLAGLRVHAAAELWPQLPPAARDRALSQALLLWREPELRRQLFLVLSDPAGVRLVTRAFSGSPRELKRMNLWLLLNAAPQPVFAR